MRAGSARFLAGAAMAALLVCKAAATDGPAPDAIQAAPATGGAPATGATPVIEAEPTGRKPPATETTEAPADTRAPSGARSDTESAEAVAPEAPPLPAIGAASEPAMPSIDALVPVPEPADVRPPGLADVAPPVDPAPATAAAAPVVASAKDADPANAAAPAGDTAAAPVAAIDEVAVTEALRALLAERGGGAEERRLRETLAQAYEARGFKPLWIERGKLAARAEAVRTVLAAAAAEGLDPADYPLPDAPAATATGLAAVDLKYSMAAVTYARHAMAGRVEPARVHPLVTPRRTIPKPEEVIARLAQAADPGAELAAYNPPHAGYWALKEILAEMRRTQPAAGGAPRIASGPVLRPGARDQRVPQIRARLGVAGDEASTVYDSELVEAVKAFQAKHDLADDGVVGAQTLAALNGGLKATVNDLIANMERWRWLPRDLGATHIMVNIPEFTVRIWQNGQMVHRTRVVAGKTSTPTPVFTDNMEYVVINPAWNVPPSIVKNEMLPLLATDPEAITRQGLEVMVNGRPVDPYEVYGVDPNRISFRQPPGERNALGRIKFMFPNRHHVYLHDTPTRHLFAREVRTFSHGCIRVHEPLKFGEVVFGLGLPGETWSPSRIESMFGREERIIKFREQFPVHVVYFTTMVDETGTLVVRDDVYRHNAQVKALLGLEGEVRRYVPPPSAKPVAFPPPMARPVGPPPSFLEQLFGLRPSRGG